MYVCIDRMLDRVLYREPSTLPPCIAAVSPGISSAEYTPAQAIEQSPISCSAKTITTQHIRRKTPLRQALDSVVSSSSPVKMATNGTDFVSVTPLLKRLSTLESARQVEASEIAAAVGLIFDNRISPIQFALLLWALHTTGQDHSPEVLAACAASMRGMAAQVDVKALKDAVASRSLAGGHYQGGLVRYAQQKLPFLATPVADEKTVRHSRHGRRRSRYVQRLNDLINHCVSRPDDG